jgi:hypothetical protein
MKRMLLRWIEHLRILINVPRKVGFVNFIYALLIENIAEQIDECSTATEIYKCGLEKDSAFTTAMMTESKGSGAVSVHQISRSANYNFPMNSQPGTLIDGDFYPVYRHCEISEKIPCTVDVEIKINFYTGPLMLHDFLAKFESSAFVNQ